jgi:hypothetical protein
VSRLPLAIALTAIATSLPSAAAGAPAATLQGVVGPGFTISLRNADGTSVTHLDPGSYTITVDDRSVAHNFHLSGPGVDQFTEVATTGMVTWTVTFVDGTYKYVCDAHPTLKGSFTVGNMPTPTPGVPRLNAKVSARAISLTTKTGARVQTLLQGSYRVAVTDSSKTQNFHLRGPGVNRKTKVGATGKASWPVNLSPGTYVYRSDKSSKLRRTFSVKGRPPVA